MASERAVVFVDLLGFASLLEAAGADLPEQAELGFAAGVNWKRYVKQFGLPETDPILLLRSRFDAFQAIIGRAWQRLADTDEFTCYLFSDSAYLTLASPTAACALAQSLMVDLVLTLTPARIGVAYGPVSLIRTFNDNIGRINLNGSVFLGAGISRAYMAESCGVPGLRILLHPSVLPFVSHTKRITALHPREVEAQRQKRPDCSPVHFELNYALSQGVQRWLGDAHYNRNMRRAVGLMKRASSKPVHYHYNATLQALHRMTCQRFGIDLA